MSRIVTLTAAGAIDATYRVASLRPGTFTRADSYTREVSGKGVNVSAALAAGGADTAAVVVLGADDVRFARCGLTAPLLRIVEVPGATRVNTSIVDAVGATTKVNAPTPPLSKQAWDATVAVLREELSTRGDAWLVISGSLPELAGTGAIVDLGGVRDSPASSAPGSPSTRAVRRSMRSWPIRPASTCSPRTSTNSPRPWAARSRPSATSWSRRARSSPGACRRCSRAWAPTDCSP